MAEFKGIPVSSKSAMEVPITVVSQPTISDVDKTDTVTSGHINPADFQDSVIPEDFMNASIVAIPKRLPSMLDLRPKDPNWCLRWVEFRADGGRNFEERRALGFQIAKLEDVANLETDNIMVKPDGIRYHDVVLMKIPTRTLWGWYKHNAITSLRSVQPRKMHTDAAQQGNKLINDGIAGEDRGGRTIQEAKDLISVYVPTPKD